MKSIVPNIPRRIGNYRNNNILTIIFNFYVFCSMKKISFWIWVVSFIVLLPIFFINYRLTVFNTFPHDDYHSVLLYWDGKLPDFEFFAPTCYRFFYHVVAFFWYKCMPLISLSQTPEGLSTEFIKAKQALAFTSFLFLHLYFWITWRLLYEKYKYDLVTSLGVASIFLMGTLWLHFHGNDPVFLFYTTLLLYFIEKKGIFYLLMLSSVVVNEKISLMFLIFFGMVCLSKSGYQQWKTYFLTSLTALGLYFVMRHFLHFPGYENQTDLTLLWVRIQMSLPYIFSFKGLYINILPLISLIGLSYILKQKQIFSLEKICFHPAIAFLPIIFWGIGVFTCSDTGIGRSALFTLPFFILPVAALLHQLNQTKTAQL
jgi:hypothetical protein